MRARIRSHRLSVAAAVTLTLAATLLAPAQRAAAAESLSVNLASVTGPATGVGEGFLYGVSQTAHSPATSTCCRWASTHSAAAGT